MLVGAYRAEDAQTSPFLQAFRETERRGLQRLNLRDVEVGPLSADEARRLAVMLLEAEGDSVEQAAMVAQESGGSPFFTKELTRYFLRLPRPDARSSRFEDHPRFSLVRPASTRPASAADPGRRRQADGRTGVAGGRRIGSRSLVISVTIEGRTLDSSYGRRPRAPSGDLSRPNSRGSPRRWNPTRCESVHRCLADVIQAALEASDDELCDSSTQKQPRTNLGVNARFRRKTGSASSTSAFITVPRASTIERDSSPCSPPSKPIVNTRWRSRNNNTGLPSQGWRQPTLASVSAWP